MRVMFVLLLGLGCRPPVAASSTPRPLESPALAEDLDPDPHHLQVRLVAEQAEDGSYAYSGQRPGPTLRAKVGDRVTVELVNRLDSPTTIHWHGVGVPNDMDGVPWVNGTVAPQSSFTYRFTVQAAGTFWYHPHFDTAHQVDRGLYGAFIVEEPSPPPLEERILILDDPDEPDASAPHGHGKLARTWLLNGDPAPAVLTSTRGARYRLRLINASNAAYLQLEPEGLEVAVVAGDQGVDGGPRPLPLLLGPGDRAELDVATSTGGCLRTRPYSLNGGGVPWKPAQDLVRFEVQAPSPPPPAPSWPFSHEQPGPAPRSADIVWTFIGSDRSGHWSIDGQRFPDITPARWALDAPLVIEVRNMSPTEHPFHLHGFPFEVASRNGVQPEYMQVEDTLNVGIRERVRLRVHPDRPGDWMAHCHILPHAEDGMMTVLRIEP